jgi:hypothetical protein
MPDRHDPAVPDAVRLWGHYKAQLQAYLDDELALMRLLRARALDGAQDVVAGLEGRGRVLKSLEDKLDLALLAAAPLPPPDPEADDDPVVFGITRGYLRAVLLGTERVDPALLDDRAFLDDVGEELGQYLDAEALAEPVGAAGELVAEAYRRDAQDAQDGDEEDDAPFDHPTTGGTP